MLRKNEKKRRKREDGGQRDQEWRKKDNNAMDEVKLHTINTYTCVYKHARKER